MGDRRALLPDLRGGSSSPIRPMRTRLTDVAGTGALCMTAYFVVLGRSLLRTPAASADTGLRERMVLAGIGGQPDSLLAIIGACVLGVCLMTAVLGIGLFARRMWAREGAMFVFGLFGSVLLALSLAGAASGGANAGFGIVIAIVDMTIAALLLTDRVADDFDEAESTRLRS